MKYLKLLFIFVLVAGGLVAAFMLNSLAGPKISEKTEGGEDLANEMSGRIESQWKDSPDWDRELYRSFRSEIAQDYRQNLIDESSYKRVRNKLRENAINKLHESFTASLQAEGYSDAKVHEYHKEVAFLAEEERIFEEDDSRLKHINDLFELYNKIDKYVHSSHVIKPGLYKDKEKWTWKSFSDKTKDEKQTATDFKKHALYKEMMTVPGFAIGLDEKLVEKKCNESKGKFYDDLSGLIEKRFNDYTVSDSTSENHISIYVKNGNKWVDKEKLTKERLTQLENMWSRLDDEESGKGSYNEGPGSTKLKQFMKIFKDDYDAMNKKINSVGTK